MEKMLLIVRTNMTLTRKVNGIFISAVCRHLIKVTEQGDVFYSRKVGKG
ncbi:hypothetical protein [Terrimonas alba]